MEKEMKRCPYCGELIMKTARKCRYCGSWLDGSHGYDNQESPQVSPAITTPTVSAVDEIKGNPQTEAVEQKAMEPEAITTANNAENEEPNINEPAEQNDTEVEYDDDGDPIEEESNKQQVLEFIGMLMGVAGFICFAVWKFSDAGNTLFFIAIGLCFVGFILAKKGIVIF